VSAEVRIAAAVWDAIADHAAEAFPEECCGLLISDGSAIVSSARARNLADEPRRRFLIDPADHFAAIRAARAAGRAVVGAYHSHPEGEPLPSETDRAEALDDPEFVHVIVRPGRPPHARAAQVAGFRVIAGAFVTQRLVRVALALLCVLCAACGDSPTGPSRASPEDLQHVTTNFVFHYTPADREIVAAIATAAEQPHARITSELRVPGMRQVHVYYYETVEAMRAAVRPVVGEIPPWATGLVTGADRVHLVSPASLGQTVDRAALNVVHEFAHCVTLALEPRAGNNPRWLWESVALYEARQFVDPRGLPYLTALQPPSLSELSSFADTRIYEVGFLIGEFVVERWGTAALPSLITALGNTSSALGVSEAEFERDWLSYVRTRYGM
jgi:proteasome lid subunit RPN8/RPN11